MVTRVGNAQGKKKGKPKGKAKASPKSKRKGVGKGKMFEVGEEETCFMLKSHASVHGTQRSPTEFLVGTLRWELTWMKGLLKDSCKPRIKGDGSVESPDVVRVGLPPVP